MADTKIEWTDKTWNPVTGCTKISEGCQHCYAERMSKRLAGRCGYDKDDPFTVTLHPDKLNEPLKWKKPSKIFVCSMGDLFHDDVSLNLVDKIFAVMALCPQHIFILLTKRPERMKRYFYDIGGTTRRDWVATQICKIKNTTRMPSFDWPLPNVWLGVTTENQKRADERVSILLDTPAAVRLASVEPMLTEVKLNRYLKYPICKHWKKDGNPSEYGKYQWEKQSLVCADWVGLDWVICGGETGPGARPMHPDWVRSLRDQCVSAGTPFFFKSWGDWAPGKLYDPQPFSQCNIINLDGGELTINSQLMRRVGKKQSGRLLDGRDWNEYPEGRDKHE